MSQYVLDLLPTICCGFVTSRECGMVLFSVACVCQYNFLTLKSLNYRKFRLVRSSSSGHNKSHSSKNEFLCVMLVCGLRSLERRSCCPVYCISFNLYTNLVTCRQQSHMKHTGRDVFKSVEMTKLWRTGNRRGTFAYKLGIGENPATRQNR